MRTKTFFNFLMTISAILFLCNIVIRASETPKILWNKEAQSEILNKSELNKIASALDSWKIKQIIWPSADEIDSNSVKVDDKLKTSCMDWLKKFMSKEYLPEDMKNNLIAMKNWGLITEESKQKRLCDVFMTRFKKDNYVIHIQESPGNVVIAVSDERLVEKTRTDYRDWVLEAASKVLDFEKLKPNPDMLDVRVSEIERDKSKIIKVSWPIGSITIRTDSGTRLINGKKATKIGASHVSAETNGKFIIFNIQKEIGGPTHPNYYQERFILPEKQTEPNAPIAPNS